MKQQAIKTAPLAEQIGLDEARARILGKVESHEFWTLVFDERDLAIAAERGRIIGFDNLTYLSESLSNALCRLSTGGGFATRELYSDEGEVIFDSQRPIILNGISEVVSKSDLLDRSILLYLPRIKKGARKLERTLDREFKAAQPRILGALLDAVSDGLRQIAAGFDAGDDLPRMADFYEWALACEKGLGLKPGTFAAAYRANIEQANGLAIEASPVAQAIVTMVMDCDEWQGTVCGLLTALTERLTAAGENPKQKRGWPQTPRKLGALLKEYAPNLRRNGIGVETGDRTRQGILVTLTKLPQEVGNNVHNVHNVHPTNNDKGLEREHCGEHLENDQPGNVHAAAEAQACEHWGNEQSGDVHTNVHALNPSKQRLGERCEHCEHPSQASGGNGAVSATPNPGNRRRMSL